MRLLDLAIKAKAVITGQGKWTKDERDDGDGAHCALGAIEEALGLQHETAENHPQASKLVVEMALQQGYPTFEQWKADHPEAYGAEGLRRM